MEEDNREIDIDSLQLFSTTETLLFLREFDSLLKKNLCVADWKEDEKFAFSEAYPFLAQMQQQMKKNSIGEEKKVFSYRSKKRQINEFRWRIFAIVTGLALGKEYGYQLKSIYKEDTIEIEDDSLAR